MSKVIGLCDCGQMVKLWVSFYILNVRGVIFNTNETLTFSSEHICFIAHACRRTQGGWADSIYFSCDIMSLNSLNMI